MKRLHIHVAVDDLAQSRAFYATLFGAEPSVVENDYAKWLLEDPRVNFAISQRGRSGGVDHLGLQVETAEELSEIAARLKAAGETIATETDAACCYARSDKAWAVDPQGIHGNRSSRTARSPPTAKARPSTSRRSHRKPVPPAARLRQSR